MATRRPPVKPKGVTKKAKRQAPRMPTITTDVVGAAVDQLPPSGRAANPATMRMAHAMANVREAVATRKVKKEAWVPIATFTARRGASNVAKAMREGKRPVDGALKDWDIETRREGAGSVLYVRLR